MKASTFRGLEPHSRMAQGQAVTRPGAAPSVPRVRRQKVRFQVKLTRLPVFSAYDVSMNPRTGPSKVLEPSGEQDVPAVIRQKRWFVPSVNPTWSACPAGGGDESLNVTSDIVAPGPTGDSTASGACDSSGGV